MNYKNKKIPCSFTFLKKGNLLILIRKTYKDLLIKQGIENPDKLIREDKSTEYFQGRHLTPSVLIRGTKNERMVVRHYMRGGFVRLISRDVFLGRLRPLNELIVSEEALGRGVPTSEILAVLQHKFFGWWYRADMVSKQIQGGVDLITCFKNIEKKPYEKPGKKKLKEKRELIYLVAGAINKMHQANIYHADLHPKNILIQNQNSGQNKAYIIDFDKSSIKKKISYKQKTKNLYRFHRSIEKTEKKGLYFTRTDQYRFFKHYLNDDKNLKAAAINYLKGYGAHRKIHRLGRYIANLFFKKD